MKILTETEIEQLYRNEAEKYLAQCADRIEYESAQWDAIEEMMENLCYHHGLTNPIFC